MAATFIQLGTTPNANQLRASLIIFKAQLGVLANIYGQMACQVDNPANPTVFTGIESVYGLQTGQGQEIWNLFTAANSLLNNGDLTTFITSVG